MRYSILVVILVMGFPPDAQNQRRVKKSSPIQGAYSEGIFMADLAQGEKFRTLIDHVEGKIASGDPVNIEHLFWLCTSYESLGIYDLLYARIEMFESLISEGDKMFYGSDLSVYPYIYRARYYQATSNYLKAIQETQKGFELLHSEGRRDQPLYRYQMIEILGIQGASEAITGQYESSQKAVQKISQISLDNSILGPEKYSAIARIHMANRDFEKALSAISNPYASVDGGFTQYYNTSFQDIPKQFIYHKCLYELGRFDEAKSGYEALLNHENIDQMGDIHWILLLDRAKMHGLDAEEELAKAALVKAVEITEQIRSSIWTEAGRIGFIENKQLIYQELISLLVESGQPQEAFHYVERSKARTLVDLLGSVSSIRVGSIAIPESESMLQLINEAESEMESSLIRGDSAGYLRNLKIRNNQLETILSEAPELENLVTMKPVKVGTIQASLDQDECILEYYYTENKLYLFVVDPESVHAEIIDVNIVHLESSIYFLRSRISTPNSGAYIASAQMLYNLLILPVESHLKDKNVIIVPHGALHYLPYSVLYSGDRFLLETMTFRYLPSAEVLSLLKRRKQKGISSGLVLGNPDLGDPEFALEFAEKEAAEIASLFPGSALHTGSSATETVVKSEGWKYNFIHFANHGIFFPENPLKSFLLLSPDQKNDGQLTAKELYTLKLNAELVTLSACESGLGKTSSGDDVIGFIRGLLFAGANSIVSSLWNVDDQSTSEMMVDFYKNLKQMERHKALQEAQIKSFEKYEHPFYWAPFTLIGNKN